MPTQVAAGEQMMGGVLLEEREIPGGDCCKGQCSALGIASDLTWSTHREPGNTWLLKTGEPDGKQVMAPDTP